MELLCDYMEPDYGIPMLNDTNYGHLGHVKDLYEFPYRELGGKKLAFVLNTYYQKESRDNLEAFLYGADTIEPDMLPMENFHTTGDTSGHTILRGPEGRYLLFKHDATAGNMTTMTVWESAIWLMESRCPEIWEPRATGPGCTMISTRTQLHTIRW